MCMIDMKILIGQEILSFLCYYYVIIFVFVWRCDNWSNVYIWWENDNNVGCCDELSEHVYIMLFCHHFYMVYSTGYM